MNCPVLISHQGETIAVAYDLSGIERAVQERFVDPNIYLVGVSFMKAEFSNGMTCDLEEFTVYPLNRKFRNTDLKVGDKVRVCMEPLKKDSSCDLAPEPQYEGRIATILGVAHKYSHADHDYDCLLDFGDADLDWIDTQYLEAVSH